MRKKGSKIKGVQYRKVYKCLNLHLDSHATKLILLPLRQRRMEARSTVNDAYSGKWFGALCPTL